MKLHKPAVTFAALAITVLLASSTAYAITHWDTITSIFRSETRLPSGNRIVAIDTENCQYFGKPNPEKSNQKSHYYEIAKNSSLTNDEIVMMIKGLCEEDRNNGVANTIIQQFLKDNRNIMSSQTSLLKDIGNTKLTLVPDPQYDLTTRRGGEVTYTFTNQTKVFDGTNPARLSDIKSGDTVVLIVHDQRTVGSEGDANDPNHWDDPQFLTVLAIIRVPALSGSPDMFYKHLGKEFVRTEPCTTDPSGFCRAYDFDK